MKPLVFVLWLALGVFYWWLDHSIDRQCCTAEVVETGTIVSPATKEVTFPLAFLPSDSDPETGEGFIRYRDSILSSLSDDETLVIKGLYHPDETNPTQFENLGLARASYTKELFAQRLDTSRIQIRSALQESDEGPGEGLQERVIYDVIQTPQKIVEIEDRTLIYFPYNSFKRLKDAEIEEYLKNVAERVKESGEVVELVGHTDSSGNASYNYTLGLSRANIISGVLQRYGIPKSQIKVSSLGETQPIAPNLTEEGRSKNRRTELVIASP